MDEFTPQRTGSLQFDKKDQEKAPLKARLICEFLGTCLFIFFAAGCAAESVVEIQSEPPTPKQSSLLVISTGHAIAAMWLVYIFGPISGAHFNAGATLVFGIHNRTPIVEMIGYWIAQALGSLVGGALLIWLYGTESKLGVPGLSDDSKLVHGFAVEFLCTIVLSFVLLFTSTYSTRREAALIVGSVVFSSFLLGGNVEGTALNPWRWLGPAVASRTFRTELWIYWVGPLGGFCVGYILFLLYRALLQGKFTF